jgi:hypothetical protein
MQVVNAALKRDGEVDEVGPAAAQQDALRDPEPANPGPEPGATREREQSGDRARDRDDQLEAQRPAPELSRIASGARIAAGRAITPRARR